MIERLTPRSSESKPNVAATMRSLVLQEPGCIAVCQTPVPEPRAGEVLIEVKAATTCGTDLKAYTRGHPQIPMPGLFGHEYSGVVSAVGEGAPFEVGQAVMGVHSAPCQNCYWCERGQENLCESIMATKVLGSYAEYLLVPAHVARLNLFDKPDELSFDRASLLEPLACVAQAVSLLPVQADAEVLVIGPGAIGLMFVSTLRHLGYTSITLAGRNPKRLEVGGRIGAKTAPLHSIPLPHGRGFDLVIECTGSVEVWEQSLGFVRRGGTVVLFGGCPTGTHAAFDTRRVHYDQITLLSPFHFGTQAVRQAREWLLDPTLNLDGILSGERELEEGDVVFEDLRAGRGIKYVFRP
ncbi:MAG TPA: alcohol dehydrogenase catalytic domain-containing protein [Fimbriimonadaceae bacterium]|nr:alcohol dehydrogenase catalytic domain-containing protein [Fimbriimonadaceae bacterium]